MIHIKSSEDFKNIENKAILDLLKEEFPCVANGDLWHDYTPEDAGWLVIFEESDSLSELPEDFPYNIETMINFGGWEWAKRDEKLDAWIGVIISGNQFGLCFYVPSKLLVEGVAAVLEKKKTT